MRLAAILREVRRNITTGTARFTMFGLTLAVLTCGLIYTDETLINGQINTATRFRDAGGSTLILTAEKHVDPVSCDALAGVPGVIASGALRNSVSKVQLKTLPNAPIPEFEVTGGFPKVLAPTATGVGRAAGLIISDEAATTVGAAVGTVIATTRGDVPVAGVFLYPADGRRPGFGYAALSITSDQRPFDECWIATWPEITNARALLLAALVAGEAGPANKPIIAQLNSAFGANFPGNSAFLTRVTRGAPALMGALAAVLGFIAVRTRRLQLASALHSGIRKRDLLIMHILETAAWTVTATVISLGTIAFTTNALSNGDTTSAVANGIAVPLASFAGALIGTAIAVAMTRERHLFRYFKDR